MCFLLSTFCAPDKLELKRRRTERIRRERIDSSLTNDMENRRRSRTNSQSDPIRRGRGRPKTVGLKKQEEEKGKISDYLWFHLQALIKQNRQQNGNNLTSFSLTQDHTNSL